MKRAFSGKRQKLPLNSEADVKEILSQLKGNQYTVEKVTKKERKRNPALPFTTSTLQQEAARKLNFRAKKTMMIAQQLYEGIDLGREGTVGLITYMRTDSTRISNTAVDEAAAFIDQTYGKEFLGGKRKPAKRMKMPRMPTKQFGRHQFLENQVN